MFSASDTGYCEEDLVGRKLNETNWAGTNWININHEQAIELIDEAERAGVPRTLNHSTLADRYGMMKGLVEMAEALSTPLGPVADRHRVEQASHQLFSRKLGSSKGHL